MNSNFLIGALVVGVMGVLVVYTFIVDKEYEIEEENSFGSEVMNEVSLPSDLPSNIPLYPGSVLTAVQDIPHETDKNITLTLETPDSVADVNTWYRGALSEGGWAITSVRNVGGYILLKGENENVAVFTQVASRGDLGVSVITERIQIR